MNTMKMSVRSPIINSLINIVLFQIGWLGCVLGGSETAIWLAPILLTVHFLWFQPNYSELALIAAVALMGLVIDSSLHLLGVFSFNEPVTLMPLWLFSLWVLFATTLNHSMSWLSDRTLVCIIFGFIGGGMSYVAGHHFESIIIVPWGEAIIGLVWAIILPIIFKMNVWFKSKLDETSL